MTDNEYGTGYQTPSSRPPEPPYRQVPANAPEPRYDAAYPDTRSVSTSDEVVTTQGYAPVAASEPTESFAAARSGDTGSMPRTESTYNRVDQGAQGGYVP